MSSAFEPGCALVFRGRYETVGGPAPGLWKRDILQACDL